MQKTFLHLRTARLFSGIAEEDLEAIFGALIRKPCVSPYIFRAGEPTEALGLIVAGNAFIVQEDFWGNRNILSSAERSAG